MSYDVAKRIAKHLVSIRTLEEWDQKRDHAIQMLTEYHDEHLSQEFEQMKSDEMWSAYGKYANSVWYEDDKEKRISEQIYFLYEI